MGYAAGRFGPISDPSDPGRPMNGFWSGTMSHDHSGPDDNIQGSLDRVTLDRLVRLAADGELSADESAAYARAKAGRPDLVRRESAERSMRAAVNRCMCDGCECPQALRDRITALTGQVRLADADPAPMSQATATDASDAPVVRFPTWQRVIALAAAIVIVAAVSAYFRGNAPTQPAGLGVAQAGAVPTGVQLAGFMTSEHSRCASHPTSIRKFTERDLQKVPQAFREILGNGFTAQDLTMDGASFIAAGRCQVPGKGPSIHVMFETLNPEGQAVEVSLYIQRCGDKRFEEGKAYAVGAESVDAASIIGWRHDGLVYYLVTFSPETTRSLATKFQAPAIAGAI
ncbi:hypothetical protein AY599_26055 [Leptolyngbya valderiana BDU 20041]|nr:hypothetical protein AY599_26055 [Leptolyngbya valderiana BDU 20041]